MRHPVLFLSVLFFLSSCGLSKRKYVEVNVHTSHISVAEYEGDNTYYTFRLDTGALSGHLFQVTLVDGGKTAIYGDLVHPSRTERCEPLKRPKWSVKEKINESKTEVNMKGKIRLTCDGKKYMITFSYEGGLSRKAPNQIH